MRRRTVRPAGVDVAAGAVPAVADAGIAGGREDDVAVRQPLRFGVRHREILAIRPLLGERETRHPARRKVHLVERGAVAVVVVPHIEEQRRPVPGEIWMGDKAFRLVDQHLMRD